MTKGFHVNWFKNLKSEEEKEGFKALLTTSPVVRRIKEILREKVETNHRMETTLTDYESASWAYKQADRNGYMRCLKELNELFNFIEE